MQKRLQWWWLTSSLWIICLCIINLENLKLAKHITSVRFLTCDCSNFFQGILFSIFMTYTSPSFNLGVNYSTVHHSKYDFQFLSQKAWEKQFRRIFNCRLTTHIVYCLWQLAFLQSKEVAFKYNNCSPYSTNISRYIWLSFSALTISTLQQFFSLPSPKWANDQSLHIYHISHCLETVRIEVHTHKTHYTIRHWDISGHYRWGHPTNKKNN